MQALHDAQLAFAEHDYRTAIQLLATLKSDPRQDVRVEVSAAASQPGNSVCGLPFPFHPLHLPVHLGTFCLQSESQSTHWQCLFAATCLPQARANMSIAYLALGRVANALDRARDAVHLDPACVPALLALASAHMANQDWSKAKRRLKQALKVAPHHQGESRTSHLRPI